MAGVNSEGNFKMRPSNMGLDGREAASPVEKKWVGEFFEDLKSDRRGAEERRAERG
jgi:hypothetical protein